jgi:two-component system nitrogen regulation response regulator GlnG
MSAAAVSYPTVRPVLPFLRPADADPEAASYHAAVQDLSAHPATAELAELLLIGGDPARLAGQLRRSFPEPGYRVRVAGSGPGGVRCGCAASADVVVLDLDLPESGLDVYQQIRQINPRVPVVFVTGARRPDLAIEAMKQGAFDVLFKPVDLPALRRVVGEALDVSRRMRESPARIETGTDPDADGELVGSCPAMVEVYKAIGRVAGQAFPVLVSGESGTGKELVARAIYRHGPRANAPFLALNCAAVPETLLESELFGHEKGAFTGADRRRIGKFEQAHGGVVVQFGVFLPAIAG